MPRSTMLCVQYKAGRRGQPCRAAVARSVREANNNRSATLAPTRSSGTPSPGLFQCPEPEVALQVVEVLC